MDFEQTRWKAPSKTPAAIARPGISHRAAAPWRSIARSPLAQLYAGVDWAKLVRKAGTLG